MQKGKEPGSRTETSILSFLSVCSGFRAVSFPPFVLLLVHAIQSPLKHHLHVPNSMEHNKMSVYRKHVEHNLGSEQAARCAGKGKSSCACHFLLAGSGLFSVRHVGFSR